MIQDRKVSGMDVFQTDPRFSTDDGLYYTTPKGRFYLGLSEEILRTKEAVPQLFLAPKFLLLFGF